MDSSRDLTPKSEWKQQPEKGTYQAPAIIYEGEITVRAGTQLEFGQPNQGPPFSSPGED